MPEQWARIVNCHDLAGRPRQLVVTLADDGTHDIFLKTPAGEVGRLDPSQIQDVKQALTDAQVEAIHRRNTW